MSSGHFRRFGRHILYDHHLPPHLENHAPGLHKWWKGWTRVNGQIIEHISPYQNKPLHGLFKDPIHKITHKIMENWAFIPPFLIAEYIWWWSPKRFHEYEKEEWP